MFATHKAPANPFIWVHTHVVYSASSPSWTVGFRKVAGEVNLADLFTKHSLSKLRVEQFVELHGCRFFAGRAASAPLARTGASNKLTTVPGGGATVDAVADNSENKDEASRSDLQPPVMPHLICNAIGCGKTYTSIKAPTDNQDIVLQHG